MNTRPAGRFILLVFAGMLLLACDIAGSTGPIPGGSPGAGGAVPTTAGPGVGQPSQVPDHLKCDPQKLSFPLLPDARNCQHLDIITNFQTSLSPNDVIVTYHELLAKEGWARKDDGALPGMGSWVKGAQQLHIVAAVDNGVTVVQIQEIGAVAAAPTNIPRGVTPAPTNIAEDATPMPTSRISIPPGEPTIPPGTAEPQGEFVWTGMSTKGQIINFCVYRNQVYRIHYVTQIFCLDKQTGNRFSHWVNISPSDLPPFLLYPNGRFNINGEYTIPDGVYKDVTFGMIGYLRGSRGRVWINVTSENEVVRCDEGDMPVGIDVWRTNAQCSP